MGIWNHFEDPIMALDAEQRVVGLNDPARKLIGEPLAQCVGKPCHKVVPAVDHLTGRPCAERCPVFRSRTHDWAHIRRLHLNAGRPSPQRLECLLLRCIDTQAGLTLALLTDPDQAVTWDEPSAIELTQEMLPALLGLATRERAAELALELAVTRTGALSGEIRIAHSVTDELAGEAATATAFRLGEAELRTPVTEDLHAQAAAAARPALRVTGRSSSELREPSAPACFLCVPILGMDRVAATVLLAYADLPARLGRTIRILFPLSVQFGAYLGRATRAESMSEAAIRDTLRIEALGGFEVEAAGRRIPAEAFKRRGALEILKRLIATPQWRARRDELAFELWPDQPEAAVSGNLRVVLHSLKRTLEPELKSGEPSTFLEITAENVQLRHDHVSTDVDEMLACHRRAWELVRHGNEAEATRVARRGIALYRGPFLGDEESTDWGFSQRARMHEVYLDTVSLLGRLLCQASDHGGAIRLFQEALLTEPAREELHRALISAFLLAGRPHDALAQFQRCAKLLREAVGLGPTSDTIALVKQVQRTIAEAQRNSKTASA